MTNTAAPVPSPSDPDVLVAATGVTKVYPGRATLRSLVGRDRRSGLVAVAGVDLAIRAGRTLGVVGETGSGKSTLGRLVLGLEAPSAGRVDYLGQDLAQVDRRTEQAFRRDVQVVLQDPYSSLNPHMTVGQTLDETLKVHRPGQSAQRTGEADELMERVGLPPSWRDRRPQQLSGGGRQRVSIARALAVRPRVVVADEPVSALDVSVQAQVLNLLADLQAELGLAYLFITHDLAVMRRLADDLAVMYLGRVVEQGPAEALIAGPAHPYTSALLAAAPTLGRRARGSGPAVGGELPDPLSPPLGCAFHTRCPHAMDVCRRTAPKVTDLGDGRRVACHLVSGPTASSPTATTAPRVPISTEPKETQ